jgi:HEAT repeat protein
MLRPSCAAEPPVPGCRDAELSMPRLIAALVVLSSFAPHAWSHGAVWRPPSDSVTGPGGAGAPTTGGRGPATGGGARRSASTLDRWEAWWFFQREGYLPRHSAGRIATAQGGGYLAGFGATPDRGSDPSSDPTLPADARNRVLPVLVALLRDRSTEVVDSAAIAVGRAAPEQMTGPFLEPLSRTLAHAERSPQQAAVLGLGILGGAEAAAILREIVADTAAGRKLCDETGALDDLLRGMAALALGLTDQRENIELLAGLARAPGADREIAASCVLALGLHAAHAPFAMAELKRLLDDESLDRDVRAQAPIALQRLPGGNALLASLLPLLAEKATCNEVARSVAIALGALGQPEEVELLDALMRAAKSHSDAATRHLAMLSLGRIFERAGAPDDAAKERRNATQEWLLSEVRNPDRGANRPFAALSLGLVGRGDRLASAGGKVSAVTQRCGAKLIDELDLARDPSFVGALAIALGLMQAADAGPKLASLLAASSNPVEQGHLAIGCALWGETRAIPTLRERIADRSLHPAVRIDCARALGMLGDRGFEQQLLKQMAGADDLPQAAAFAKALGLLGGIASVEPLIALAQEQSIPEFRRAFAVVALGLLAEKTELPWNWRYLVDANYTTVLRPLQEVFDVL